MLIDTHSHVFSEEFSHDIDDAIRAKMITDNDIPQSAQKILGTSFSKRIDTIVTNVIEDSIKNNLAFISISDQIYDEISKLRDFLFQRVYWVKESELEVEKVRQILNHIYEYVKKEPERYINTYPEGDSPERRIIDFIAGMTDRYVLNLFQTITFPSSHFTNHLD